MKHARWPVIRKTTGGLQEQKIEQSKERKLRKGIFTTSRLMKGEMVTTIIILVVSFFQVTRCQVEHSRAKTSPFVPTDRASPVDILAISEKTVQTTLPQDRSGEQLRVRQTEAKKSKLDRQKFVKDEYYVVSMHDNSDSHMTDAIEENFEYVENSSPVIVKGKLKQNISFWRKIGASGFILDIIENGYKIPFFSEPPSTFAKNNNSAIQHCDFVTSSIKELEEKELIARCHIRPTVINPLTVSVQKNGKKRLILDLRAVNKHIWKQKVKFEDIKTALLYVKQHSWMFKFDIHSAYHHIEIFTEHTTYLGFSWEIDNEVHWFRFLVLPFGLSSAPYVFTKLSRPLVKKWRGEGIRIVLYLDDGFGTGENSNIASTCSNKVKLDILQSGFILNEDKSIWQPVQTLTWLGYTLNTFTGLISINPDRLETVLQTIDSIKSQISSRGSVSVRKLASFVGKIISMSLVIGNVAQIMTRSLSVVIAGTENWNSRVLLTAENAMQIDFWKRNLFYLNSRKIIYDPSCSRIVYSDASGTGFGGYIVHTQHSEVHGMWTAIEKTKSSTWRELQAVYKILLASKNDLLGHKVKWFTDNKNVVNIVKKGSMKLDLQNVALKIFQFCMENSISIDTEWVPREFNDYADYISNIIDYDDWSISDTVFRNLNCKWGPFEVDWFASDHNNKLDCFFSRFSVPSSSGVDAFSYDWSGQNGWFVPPPCIMARVLLKIMQSEMTCTLIFPLWRSANYWPIVCPDGVHFIPEIVECIDISTAKENFITSLTGSGVFGNIDLPFRMLAVRIDSRRES